MLAIIMKHRMTWLMTEIQTDCCENALKVVNQALFINIHNINLFINFLQICCKGREYKMLIAYDYNCSVSILWFVPEKVVL